MVLSAYQVETQRLLNDINAQFFNTADLTVYINNARNQIATIANCVIARSPLSVASSTQVIPMSSIPVPTNYGAPLNIRFLFVTNVDTSLTQLEGRPYPYFSTYYGSGPNSIATGTPSVWSQHIQGSLGEVWLYPITNATFTITFDASWTPQPLVNDSTVEVLQYPWTEAVPYYAAYLAYLEAQRPSDAANMLAMFQQVTGIARSGVTPVVQPTNVQVPKGLMSAVDVRGVRPQNAKPDSKQEGSF